MRLIDANSLKDRVSEYTLSEDEYKRFCEIIDAEPSACDVDSVVNQLEYELFRWKDSGEAYNDEKEKGIAIGFQKAIEIVKGGGRRKDAVRI